LVSVHVCFETKVHNSSYSGSHHHIGVRLEYLPPYSPDLNPIEEAFSKVKHWIRRHQDYYSGAVDDEIFYDMWEVLQVVMPSDAEGYFFHSGYF
ncbi:hypothetical protein HWV62_26947, partial [Athelia sp. TMB]